VKRLLAGAALVAAASASVPAFAAASCPTGFYSKGSGVISPLSHQEIKYCWPTPPPVR
jgi:hypothetical protein